MTTSTNTSAISHAATANFRVWGTQLSGMLDTIGFIKSADTGQIDWATVTRPGVNTSGGYEIRYMNDSLHGTAPIYVKLEYGTGAAADYPGMWVTIGTGSNGSGTITGILLVREAMQGDGFALDTTVGTKVSYACMARGCVWFAYKTENRNSTLYPVFVMSIERTKDDAGAISADGFVYYRGVNGYGAYSGWADFFMFSGGYTASTNSSLVIFGGQYAFMPYNLGALATIVAGVPGDYQIARHYHTNPQIRPLLCTVSLSPGDAITKGTTFTATVLGVTASTYICTGRAFSYYDYFGMIWE